MDLVCKQTISRLRSFGHFLYMDLEPYVFVYDLYGSKLLARKIDAGYTSII